MARRKPKRKKRRKGPRGPGVESRPKPKRRWWPAILVIIAGGVALYVYDYRGPLETVAGEVLSTRRYPHQTATEPLHYHTEAIIEVEGTRQTASEADGVRTGDQVTAVIRRGRLTGRPRLVDMRSRGSSP